ncbi:phosphotransferase, partial [Escherichia coli]|nr:phosphotransferase [Escherichia coli]
MDCFGNVHRCILSCYCGYMILGNPKYEI